MYGGPRVIQPKTECDNFIQKRQHFDSHKFVSRTKWQQLAAAETNDEKKKNIMLSLNYEKLS